MKDSFSHRIKLSFGGDMMSLLPQDEACKGRDGLYDYSMVFEPIKSVIQQSDLFCANLETTFSGVSQQYTFTQASFNTPDAFAQAIKTAGLQIVTTANNHCLDRGIAGLQRTLDVLDQYQIRHTGTYRNEEESRYILIEDINGCKIAILSFTYGTNSEYTKCFLPEDQLYLIDLLKKQAETGSQNQTKSGLPLKIRLKNAVVASVRCIIPQAYRKTVKRLLSLPDQQPVRTVWDSVADCEVAHPTHEPYLERLREKVRQAKDMADYVVVCLHVGGQYNNTLGAYTQYIFDMVEQQNPDLIIGTHPHCILGYHIFRPGKLAAYSLGNLTLTPGWGNWVDGVYAEYSVIVNVYLDTKTKKANEITFSITKNRKDAKGRSQVYMLYDLIEKESDEALRKQLIEDNYAVIHRFTGREYRGAILREYTI